MPTSVCQDCFVCSFTEILPKATMAAVNQILQIHISLSTLKMEQPVPSYYWAITKYCQCAGSMLSRILTVNALKTWRASIDQPYLTHLSSPWDHHKQEMMCSGMSVKPHQHEQVHLRCLIISPESEIFKIAFLWVWKSSSLCYSPGDIKGVLRWFNYFSYF